MTSTVREYYVTYWAPYGWLRSIDGGRCWSHDEMRDAGSNEPITGTFCPQPAADDAGQLYVAYIWLVDPQPPQVAEIRFLAGVDIDPADPNDCTCDPNDPNDAIDPNIMGVKFRPLYWGMQGLPGGAPITEPILLTVPLNRHRCDFDIPGNFESKRVPQLATVPNDPNAPVNPAVISSNRIDWP